MIDTETKVTFCSFLLKSAENKIMYLNYMEAKSDRMLGIVRTVSLQDESFTVRL